MNLPMRQIQCDGAVNVLSKIESSFNIEPFLGSRAVSELKVEVDA